MQTIRVIACNGTYNREGKYMELSCFHRGSALDFCAGTKFCGIRDGIFGILGELKDQYVI